jgi:hypothetical protein
VPTTWQREDGVPIPFENTLDEIRKFEDFDEGQRVAFIKWNAQSGWQNATSAYKGITTKDIAQGKLDNYIRQYARDVRDYGRPLFMSPICAEFNGGYWNCGPAVNRSLTVDDFIQAWRRVVNLFRQEGATNVSWVWNQCPHPEAGFLLKHSGPVTTTSTGQGSTCTTPSRRPASRRHISSQWRMGSRSSWGSGAPASPVP